MNRNFKIGFWSLLTISALAFIVFYIARNYYYGELKAKTAYRLQLENEQQERFTLNNFKGKYVFVNCWQTWCGPCVAEMPLIDSAFQRIDKNKWVFVVITDESWEKINHFKETRNFQLPFYRSLSSFVGNGIRSYPTSFILNGKGEIVWQEKGMLPFDTYTFMEHLNSFP
jgi:thiol-disulfide isomerase/thioredoxin